ncbi:hypothetical protein [Thermococcus sp. 18S1]|uniref:hypothetical protein n=1 Tax=Thermococcus sp. 18S1 TaxID=1638210 RepID=UPI00197E195A|nr:hypothetical protein [Thermococcus sp. 18S1]
MPKKARNPMEDVLRRLFVSILLIYFLKELGLLLSLFIFLSVIPAILQRLETASPSVPKPPTLQIPEILREGFIFEAPPELNEGVEALLRVGMRNVSSRPLAVTIRLDELEEYGKVSPGRINLSLAPGEVKSTFVRFIPQKTGK